MSAQWDPAVYERFRRERARPFYDLVARIHVRQPRRIADLGCGTGRLTRYLTERFPGAEVVGVDASAEMLQSAVAAPPRLRFEQADLTEWAPDAPLDLLVANASLHWVPDHPRLLARLLSHLAPKGVLAFQVPANHEAPSHTAVYDLCLSAPWRDRLQDAVGPTHVLTVAAYVEILVGAGCDVDAWETTYHHRITGPADVAAWLAGTTLRPVLSRLDAADGQVFLAQLAERLGLSYPEAPHATFPFTRRFVVAKTDSL